MLTDVRSILETMMVVGMAGGLALAGCSSDDSATSGPSTPTADAGCPGAGCPGAGCPAADAGCPGAEAGCPGAGCPGATGDAQTPPRGQPAAIDAWLAAGTYKSWKCEPAARPAVGSSPHGRARVCSNDLLSNNSAAEFPVGAAGVKEIYEGANITGLALYVKTDLGKGGAGWYWYEKLGTQVVANAKGVQLCTGCHDKAPKDQVFTQVK